MPSPQRISWGEYDWPDYRLSRSIGRTYFLHAIQDRVPAVLADLEGAPLTAYKTIADELEEDLHAPIDLRDYLNESPPQGFILRQRYIPLLEALNAWSQRWSLTAPWCRVRGFETLEMWTHLPDSQGKRWSLEGVNWSGPPTKVEITLSDAGWNPALLLWSEYEERFLAFVRSTLDAYRQKLEGMMQEQGLVRTREKREAETHFIWLVRYQIERENIYGLARDVERTWKAVHLAIQDCADFIALPLRPAARPGRPRKAV